MNKTWDSTFTWKRACMPNQSSSRNVPESYKHTNPNRATSRRTTISEEESTKNPRKYNEGKALNSVTYLLDMLEGISTKSLNKIMVKKGPGW